MRALLALALLTAPLVAQERPIPRLESKDGRHALIVDGAPFLMLGAQANNSSNYPAALPKVWPVVEAMHANTLEMPVAWEQVEPVEGRFDFGFVDTLVGEARAHGKRLVLLWFGTWKNTGASYAPEWVKRDGRRFPRMRTPEGTAHYALSPHGAETLAADRRAVMSCAIVARMAGSPRSARCPRVWVPDRRLWPSAGQRRAWMARSVSARPGGKSIGSPRGSIAGPRRDRHSA